MKAIFKVLLLIVLATKAYSQDYSFSVTNSTYTSLTDGISLTKGELVQSVYAFEIPMDSFNFQFEYNNKLYDKLVVHVDGYVELGPIDVAFPTEQFILPCYAELQDRGFYANDSNAVSLSEILYNVEQPLTSGDRILKIEWNNMAFYSDSFDSHAYTNFQLWLYENSNIIEFHYGSNLVTDPYWHFFQGAPGPIIGLLMDFEENASYWGSSIVLLNSPSNPDTLHYTGVANNSPLYITGAPNENTVYTFTPVATSSINNHQYQSDLKWYYNSQLNQIEFENLDVPLCVHLFDSKGACVYITNQLYSNYINLPKVDKGIYFLNIEEKGQSIYSTKILIQ